MAVGACTTVTTSQRYNCLMHVAKFGLVAIIEVGFTIHILGILFPSQKLESVSWVCPLNMEFKVALSGDL